MESHVTLILNRITFTKRDDEIVCCVDLFCVIAPQAHFLFGPGLDIVGHGDVRARCVSVGAPFLVVPNNLVGRA